MKKVIMIAFVSLYTISFSQAQDQNKPVQAPPTPAANQPPVKDNTNPQIKNDAASKTNDNTKNGNDKPNNGGNKHHTPPPPPPPPADKTHH